jgi:hypothetical protein
MFISLIINKYKELRNFLIYNTVIIRYITSIYNLKLIRLVLPNIIQAEAVNEIQRDKITLYPAVNYSMNQASFYPNIKEDLFI